MGTEARKAQAERSAKDDYQGGGLYTRKGGVYWADVTAGGKRYRRSLGTTDRRKAEERIEAFRAGIKSGNDVNFEARTLATAIEPFLSDHVRNLKPKTQKMYKYSLQSLLEHMPNRALEAYNKADLLAYENAMRDRGAHSQTIINYLRVFSSLMEYAVMRGWAESNPCQGYIKARRRSGLKGSASRKRYLSGEEEKRLLECALAFDAETRAGRPAARMYPRIVFAIATGLRDDEQRSLLWSDIDMRAKELTVREEVGKSGERKVPLTGAAIDVLKAQRKLAEDPEYVFPSVAGGKADNFKKAWRRVRGMAGLDDVRWHDLRRTCGCRLLERGFTIFEVQKWLGHASVTQTEAAYAFLEFEKLKGR